MKGKILLVVVAMILLSGLKNSRELNEIEIVPAIGIDISDDDKYIISAQVTNIEKKMDSSGSDSSSGSSSDIVVFESKSNSIQEALRSFVNESPQRMYLAHMQLLLISEKAAKKDMIETLDFFLRDNETSNNYILAVTKDTTPQEILTKTSPLLKSPAESMVQSIKATYKYRGTSIDNILSKNLSMLLSDKKELVATSIYLQDSSKEKIPDIDDNKILDNSEEDSSSKETDSSNSSDSSLSSEGKKTNIKIGALSYFKDNKFGGFMSEDDSLIYNVLNNNVKAAIVRSGENSDKIVVELLNSKTDLKPKVVDDKLTLDINVEMKFNVTETGKNVKFKTDEDINKYQDIIAKEVEKNIYKYIDNCKNVYNTDLVGYKEIFFKKLNKEYKKHEEEFNKDLFKTIDTNVKVKATFPNEGSANKNE